MPAHEHHGVAEPCEPLAGNRQRVRVEVDAEQRAVGLRRAEDRLGVAAEADRRVDVATARTDVEAVQYLGDHHRVVAGRGCGVGGHASSPSLSASAPARSAAQRSGSQISM